MVEDKEELVLVALHVVDGGLLVVIRIGVFWVSGNNDGDGGWSLG